MPKRRVSRSSDGDYSSLGSGSDFDDSAYASSSKPSKKTAPKRPPKKLVKRARAASDTVADSSSRASSSNPVARHARALHVISQPLPFQVALLDWYATVHEARKMPWRKPYDPNLGREDRAQRAYEVWISEIMLQQTQVATVIPYYNRWMEKFPTIRALASASIDQVNALWKGLGYYSRASRLLAGAQLAVKENSGMLPDNAKDMEAKIPGIGRYSAGAICSIAYGERVPVLDGNVNRLLSRFLALHAPPKAKATLDILWAAAAAMVRAPDPVPSQAASDRPRPGDTSNSTLPYTSQTFHPGDINQALIELGSTICKVRDPKCQECPLNRWCAAYAGGTSDDGRAEQECIIPPIGDIEDGCTLCEPVPGGGVTVYPMKPERKKSREELDLVNVVEWHPTHAPQQRFFLLVKRPQGGLLAGLPEFPTWPNISRTASAAELSEIPVVLLAALLQPPVHPCTPKGKFQKLTHTRAGADTGEPEDGALRITRVQPAGDVVHVFSHIRKTYRVQWVVLEGGNEPPPLRAGAISADVKTGPGGGKIASVRRTRSTAAPSQGGDDGEGAAPAARVARVVASSSKWTAIDGVVDDNISTGVLKVWGLAKALWEDS